MRCLAKTHNDRLVRRLWRKQTIAVGHWIHSNLSPLRAADWSKNGLVTGRFHSSRLNCSEIWGVVSLPKRQSDWRIDPRPGWSFPIMRMERKAFQGVGIRFLNHLHFLLIYLFYSHRCSHPDSSQRQKFQKIPKRCKDLNLLFNR